MLISINMNHNIKGKFLIQLIRANLILEHEDNTIEFRGKGTITISDPDHKGIIVEMKGNIDVNIVNNFFDVAMPFELKIKDSQIEMIFRPEDKEPFLLKGNTESDFNDIIVGTGEWIEV